MNTNHARKWDYASITSTPNKEKQVTVKVHKRNWITKGEKVLYTILSVSMILSGAFIVSYSSSTYTLNKDLQLLENNVEIQKADNEILLYEIEKLSLPERITKIAKDNGLTIPGADVKQAQAYNNK